MSLIEMLHLDLSLAEKLLLEQVLNHQKYFDVAEVGVMVALFPESVGVVVLMLTSLELSA